MKNSNETTRKRAVNSFKNNLYMLSMIYKISPARVIAQFILSLLNYFSWVFYSVLFVRYLFGSIEINKTFNEIVLFIAATMVLFCIIEIYSSWYKNYLCPLTDQIIYSKINMMLFEKATKVDISCYENPDFYNNYTKAIQEANTRAISVLDNCSGIIGACLSSIYVLYTMYSIESITLLFSLLPVTGNFLFGKVVNNYEFNYSNGRIHYDRQRDYVNRAVYLQNFAKEIRLSNIFNVLKSNYNKACEGLNNNVDKHGARIFHLGYIKGLVCFPLIFEGVWLYTAYRAMVTKTLLIGDFVVMTSAIVSSTWMLINLSGNIVASAQNSLFIENLKTFLNYKEKISEDQEGIIPAGYINSLEFKNITFAYDWQKEPVLRNINIKINPGEKIALVGHNGAGKTTLIKLLMRLYDPVDGEILLNGINIRDYNIKEYRRLFGTVFQDFQVISMSVLENVLMNEIQRPEQRERAIQALHKSGAYEKVISLGKGPDTILTREFDNEGAVLSGGEYQRIAISRIFARDNSIVILDEPSSALDPVSEYNMYNTMMKACEMSNKGIIKTVVIISHRLSSAVLADRILMLENGEVIEQGTHEELMNASLKYKDMFMKQAQNYIDNLEDTHIA